MDRLTEILELPEPELNRRFREAMGIKAKRGGYSLEEQAQERPITDAEIFQALKSLPWVLMPNPGISTIDGPSWFLNAESEKYAFPFGDDPGAAFKRAVICATIYSKIA